MNGNNVVVKLSDYSSASPAPMEEAVLAQQKTFVENSLQDITVKARLSRSKKNRGHLNTQLATLSGLNAVLEKAAQKGDHSEMEHAYDALRHFAVEAFLKPFAGYYRQGQNKLGRYLEDIFSDVLGVVHSWDLVLHEEDASEDLVLAGFSEYFHASAQAVVEDDTASEATTSPAFDDGIEVSFPAIAAQEKDHLAAFKDTYDRLYDEMMPEMISDSLATISDTVATLMALRDPIDELVVDLDRGHLNPIAIRKIAQYVATFTEQCEDKILNAPQGIRVLYTEFLGRFFTQVAPLLQKLPTHEQPGSLRYHGHIPTTLGAALTSTGTSKAYFELQAPYDAIELGTQFPDVEVPLALPVPVLAPSGLIQAEDPHYHSVTLVAEAPEENPFGSSSKTIVPNPWDDQGPTDLVMPAAPDPEYYVSGVNVPHYDASVAPDPEVDVSEFLEDFPLVESHPEATSAYESAVPVKMRTSHGFSLPQLALKPSWRTTVAGMAAGLLAGVISVQESQSLAECDNTVTAPEVGESYAGAVTLATVAAAESGYLFEANPALGSAETVHRVEGKVLSGFHDWKEVRAAYPWSESPAAVKTFEKQMKLWGGFGDVQKVLAEARADGEHIRSLSDLLTVVDTSEQLADGTALDLARELVFDQNPTINPEAAVTEYLHYEAEKVYPVVADEVASDLISGVLTPPETFVPPTAPSTTQLAHADDFGAMETEWFAENVSAPTAAVEQVQVSVVKQVKSFFKSLFA